MTYSSIKVSKTLTPVPIFSDGRPAASLYDSKKSAQAIVARIEKADFFFVLGITDGAVIETLLATYPCAKILAFERDACDIDFLKNSIPTVKKLLTDKRVATCTCDTVKKVLTSMYFPTLYPKFTLVRTQNKWDDILGAINETLEAIKNEFVTQSHFALWWKYNFSHNKKFATKSKGPLSIKALLGLENKDKGIAKSFKLEDFDSKRGTQRTGSDEGGKKKLLEEISFSKTKIKTFIDSESNNSKIGNTNKTATESKVVKTEEIIALPKSIKNFSTRAANTANFSKVALVVGAGPSLEGHLESIKVERERYFIFSSDTAFKVLREEGIFCDAVFTVDANPLSINHYLGNFGGANNFFIDSCASVALVRYLVEHGKNVHLFTNGNPLSLAEEEREGRKLFLRLFSGAGSVLLSALDAAFQAGFSTVKVIGADFGNFDSRSYCRGTYLTTLYTLRANRLNSFDTHFTNLYFRPQSAMKAYKESFLDYANKAGYKVTYKDFAYSLEKLQPTLYN